MNILYTLIKPSTQTVTPYTFWEKKIIKSSSFDINIFYRRITEFKHLFKFNINVSLIGDNSSSISFVQDFMYDVRFDEIVEFPANPELSHLELLLDVVIEAMEGIHIFATDFKNRDPLITANSFHKFSEPEIIITLKKVKTIYPMEAFSAN
jgi:hypothetical protein